MHRGARSVLLLSVIALLALSLVVRFCVGYQTDPEDGVNGIVVLDRPRWDAFEPKNRVDETSFWLVAGNENYVIGEELYFWLSGSVWICSLFTMVVALVLRRAYVREALVRGAAERADRE